MTIRFFSDPVRVLSSGRNPIQVLLIRSDPVRSGFCQSDPIRSGPGFVNSPAKSKFLLARPKMTQMVKMPFIVFHLARLIFTSQNSHVDMIYP